MHGVTMKTQKQVFVLPQPPPLFERSALKHMPNERNEPLRHTIGSSHGVSTFNNELSSITHIYIVLINLTSVAQKFQGH